MRRAAELALLGDALPNPLVGCVLLAPDGSVVGEGFHPRAGGPHAEVVALAAAGEKARGGTAVVTLEPCRHTGRTGPCTQALLDAGVTRVVIGVQDPYEPAAGGAEELKMQGISVTVLESGELREAIEDGNRVWLTATRRRRPFVTFKAGMTLDGRVAAADGTSRWITSPESRADVHRLRARVDTMMVGIGTVLADNPQLTVRLDDQLFGPQPLRVVLDSQHRTPATARVLDDAAETLIATADDFPGPDGRVDPEKLLAELYRRGRRHVLLEGGPRLAAGLLDAGLIDEILLYVAPLALGAGRAVLEGGKVATLADAHHAALREVNTIGPDVRLRYRL